MVKVAWLAAWVVGFLVGIAGCSARPEPGASEQRAALLPVPDAGLDAAGDAAADAAADSGLDSGLDAGATDAGGCTLDSDCGQGCAQCQAGSCIALSAQTSCRPAASICDLAEVCDGVSFDCPPDAKQATNFVCRVSAGDCDPAETCDGVSDTCPADLLKPKGSVCRVQAGMCDVAEVCDGVLPDCPKDLVAPKTQVCRVAKSGGCDVAESCDGVAVDCPPDAFRASSVVCRPAAAGGCDAAEHCSGTDGVCPPDAKMPSSFVCRAAAGPCDAAESCDGTSNACPADLKMPSTQVCNPALDVCDKPELCDGVSDACPADVKMPTTTVCRAAAAGGCDLAERCNGGDACPPDQLAAAGTVCRAAATVCDVAEKCTGTSATCPSDLKAASSQVCRPSAGPCDLAETCTGTSNTCPADKRLAAGSECQAAGCDAVTGVLTPRSDCDGTSAACPSAGPVACSPYACTLAPAASCRPSCTGDADCLAAFYCTMGSCAPRIGAGKPCASNAECSVSNPYCVDGVCCNAPCNGQCEACNLLNLTGTCSGVTGAPIGSRTACGGDGSSCNGACAPSNRSACSFPPSGTECRPASCDPTQNSELLASTCNGAGSCMLTQAISCAPYLCGATACAGGCVLDGQCAARSFCQAGSCVPKAAQGGSCSADDACGSGHCVDGVCCDSACRGQCEACNLPSGLGTCQAVSGAPHGARSACQSGDASCAGSCDGARRDACSYPGTGTSCRAAACQNGEATPAAFCDGHGGCPRPEPVSCASGCQGPLCADGNCTLDADCKDGTRYCAGGLCSKKLAPGGVCGSDSACASGFCVDGVCCDTRCNGQCEACDVLGAVGSCSATPKGESPRGGRAVCAQDGSPCGGACGGSDRNACAYPSGNLCRPGQCVAGVSAEEHAVATSEARCVGNGSCPASRDQSCGADGCDAASAKCNGSCASDPRLCALGQVCVAGECVAQSAVGSSCAADAECGSGFCVDGVCCNARCSDQCAACDLVGALGVCSPVTGASHGARAGCAGLGPCGAACDGVSTASCAFAGEAVSCGSAYCGAGVQASAAHCDGSGACAPAASIACASLSCQGLSCSDGCTDNSECAGAQRCVSGKCQRPAAPPFDVSDKGSCGCRAAGAQPGARSAALWLSVLGLLGACAATRRKRARGLRAAR